MYNNNGNEMVKSKVAVELEIPCWMDRQYNVVDEKDEFGCRVAHDVTCSDLFFFMDEVGGNINQKGDRHVGGVMRDRSSTTK